MFKSEKIYSSFFFYMRTLIIAILFVIITFSPVSGIIKTVCYDASGPCNRHERLQCAEGSTIQIKAVLGWFHQAGCTRNCANSFNTTCCIYKNSDAALRQGESDSHIIYEQCSSQSKCFPFDGLVLRNDSVEKQLYIAVEFVCEGSSVSVDAVIIIVPIALLIITASVVGVILFCKIRHDKLRMKAKEIDIVDLNKQQHNSFTEYIDSEVNTDRGNKATAKTVLTDHYKIYDNKDSAKGYFKAGTDLLDDDFDHITHSAALSHTSSVAQEQQMTVSGSQSSHPQLVNTLSCMGIEVSDRSKRTGKPQSYNHTRIALARRSKSMVDSAKKNTEIRKTFTIGPIDREPITNLRKPKIQVNSDSTNGALQRRSKLLDDDFDDIHYTEGSLCPSGKSEKLSIPDTASRPEMKSPDRGSQLANALSCLGVEVAERNKKETPRNKLERRHHRVKEKHDIIRKIKSTSELCPESRITEKNTKLSLRHEKEPENLAAMKNRLSRKEKVLDIASESHLYNSENVKYERKFDHNDIKETVTADKNFKTTLSDRTDDTNQPSPKLATRKVIKTKSHNLHDYQINMLMPKACNNSPPLMFRKGENLCLNQHLNSQEADTMAMADLQEIIKQRRRLEQQFFDSSNQELSKNSTTNDHLHHHMSQHMIAERTEACMNGQYTIESARNLKRSSSVPPSHMYTDECEEESGKMNTELDSINARKMGDGAIPIEKPLHLSGKKSKRKRKPSKAKDNKRHISEETNEDEFCSFQEENAHLVSDGIISNDLQEKYTVLDMNPEIQLKSEISGKIENPTIDYYNSSIRKPMHDSVLDLYEHDYGSSFTNKANNHLSDNDTIKDRQNPKVSKEMDRETMLDSSKTPASRTIQTAIVHPILQGQEINKYQKAVRSKSFSNTQQETVSEKTKSHRNKALYSHDVKSQIRETCMKHAKINYVKYPDPKRRNILSLSDPATAIKLREKSLSIHLSSMPNKVFSSYGPSTLSIDSLTLQENGRPSAYSYDLPKSGVTTHSTRKPSFKKNNASQDQDTNCYKDKVVLFSRGLTSDDSDKLPEVSEASPRKSQNEEDLNNYSESADSAKNRPNNLASPCRSQSFLIHSTLAKTKQIRRAKSERRGENSEGNLNM